MSAARIDAFLNAESIYQPQYGGHGSRSRYRKNICRDECCKGAERRYKRLLRARKTKTTN